MSKADDLFLYHGQLVQCVIKVPNTYLSSVELKKLYFVRMPFCHNFLERNNFDIRPTYLNIMLINMFPLFLSSHERSLLLGSALLVL